MMSVIKNTSVKLFGSARKHFSFSFDQLNDWEIGIVHQMIRSTRHKRILNLNLLINHLGNGWMYPILALAIIGWYGLDSWPVIAISALSAAIAHILYPKIKNHLKRDRPHEFDPELVIPVKPLDQYSCPSGHCMTLVAVSIPLWSMFPEIGPVIFFWWLAMAWSRLSLGHHYLSDVLLGSMIGALVGIPNTWLLS